jgi:hypothetical protein
LQGCCDGQQGAETTTSGANHVVYCHMIKESNYANNIGFADFSYTAASASGAVSATATAAEGTSNTTATASAFAAYGPGVSFSQKFDMSAKMPLKMQA